MKTEESSNARKEIMGSFRTLLSSLLALPCLPILEINRLPEINYVLFRYR